MQESGQVESQDNIRSKSYGVTVLQAWSTTTSYYGKIFKDRNQGKFVQDNPAGWWPREEAGILQNRTMATYSCSVKIGCDHDYRNGRWQIKTTSPSYHITITSRLRPSHLIIIEKGSFSLKYHNSEASFPLQKPDIWPRSWCIVSESNGQQESHSLLLLLTISFLPINTAPDMVCILSGIHNYLFNTGIAKVYFQETQ